MMLSNIFTQYSFVFKIKNKKVEIVRLDNNYVSFNFDDFYSSIINFNQINIYFLIISIFQFWFIDKNITFKELYFRNIIKSYDPLFAIGHNNDGHTYLCKKLFPNIITIVYQHNYIYNFQIEDYRKRFKGCKSDYFFVFDERHKKIFSKFISAKYLITGSLRNNEKLLRKQKKKYSIMFISEFRNLHENHFRSFSQKFIIEIISEYCVKNNYKLCIALSSLRPEKQSKLKIRDELAFFNREKYKFYIEEGIDSYELANKSELCICLSSNLGVELLSRGKKVLFLSLLQMYDKNLCYPYFVDNNSPFFYLGEDKESIFKKIDYLLKMSDNKFNEYWENSGIKIGFDKGNSILKKIVSQTIDSIN